MYSYPFTTADIPDVYTVEDAVDKMGFGLFQILLSMFAGSIWVSLVNMRWTSV